MDLTEIWGIVRRNWLFLLVSVAVGLGLGAGVSVLQPELYSATTTGYVVAGNSATVGDAFAGKNLAAEKAATYLPLVESRSVAEAVAKELGIDSEQVSLEAANEGVIFKITATADSPQLARDMADVGMRATSIAANDLETMTISGEGSGETVVRIVPVEMALTPTHPVSPNWKLNLALGLMLGLLGGFGLVVLQRTLDRRVRTTADVEELISAPALSVIPASPELADAGGTTVASGAAAEALRQLRTNLRFVNVDAPVRSIVVTSANQGEGKSTVAAQLACLLAEAGEPTIIVDADLRRPRVAKLFGIDGALGLTQVMAGSLKLTDALVSTAQPNLTILPAGRIPPNPSEIVGSKRMQSMIAHLAKTHMVVIDAAPLLPVTDGGLVSAIADGALLVIQHGKTRKEQVALAARNLDNVNGDLLGFVMNQVPRKDMGDTVYGYGNAVASPLYHYGDGPAALDRPFEDLPALDGTARPRPPRRPRRARTGENTGELPAVPASDTPAAVPAEAHH